MINAAARVPDLRMAVLLVCRNRRETTLTALRALQASAGAASLTPVLFDDDSSDGTVEAVLAEFPSTTIVRGDGKAFWNGGLHQAWTASLDLPVNAFLWLNDDVVLDPDALSRLAVGWRTMAVEQGSRFILVGATRGRDGAMTYGGQRRVSSPVALRFRPVVPDNRNLVPIDTFNGNIVLVPRGVVEEIGINDRAFFHNFGDLDYGLRATKASIPVLLMPNTLGICEGNEIKRLRGFGSPHLTLREQWRQVNGHHGLPFRSWWRFTRRYGGYFWLLHFLLPYRHLLKITRLPPIEREAGA